MKAGPKSRLYLAYISPISRLYLPYISPTSRLYLPTSPLTHEDEVVSPLHLATDHGQAAQLGGLLDEVVRRLDLLGVREELVLVQRLR